jgi:hypothetical protein
MMTCQELDALATPFIDGVCSDPERAAVLEHLQQCADCQRRVDAESTARHVLHTHAAVARTMGVSPPWRPRVFRLGQPVLPVRSAWLILVAILGAGSIVWLRPAPVTAVGFIGDSYCRQHHLFTARFNVGDRECTLGCVKRGAEFVLVTETEVYRIHDRQRPDLAALANRRVKVEGTLEDGRLLVASLTAF